MVENDEPLPTLWYTKMAHTHTAYTAYIKTPKCGIWKGCLFWFNSPFKKCSFCTIFDELWLITKDSKGKTTYILRIGWLKMMSLCPHSGTLRWHTHTHTSFTAYRSPIVEFARAVFLGQFFLSKMLVLQPFLRIVAHNPKLEGGRNLSSQMDG